MAETVKVTRRGVLTIPVRYRKFLGINGEGQVVIEEREDGLLLRPAITLPLELYSDEQIVEFDAEEATLARALSKKRK